MYSYAVSSPFAIITELIAFNNLDADFKQWINESNNFCNSLVDRIVTGRPSPEEQELFEETGALADEMINIGSFQALNGLMHDECHVFIAKVTEQHAQQLDDTECIDLLYRRPDEVEELISRNAIWDGQTMAAWALARAHFFKEKTPPSSPTFGPIQHMIDELIGN